MLSPSETNPPPSDCAAAKVGRPPFLGARVLSRIQSRRRHQPAVLLGVHLLVVTGTKFLPVPELIYCSFPLGLGIDN